MTTKCACAVVFALLVSSLACGSVAAPTATPTNAPAQTSTPPPKPNAAPTGIRILVTYSETNREYFPKIARPDDRFFFFGREMIHPSFEPSSVPETGEIVVAWPSWEQARRNESAWAPYADVFAYDVEYDSPADEIADLDATLAAMRAWLGELSARYGHSIRLSCGLNLQFGSAHVQSLAQCDDVHIHANGLLRVYPEKDQRNRMYVNWAVGRAEEAHAANPNVGLWFAALVPEMDLAMS
ncbi:MAG: hypothetical protein AB1750_15240, partial [Chloroflexota bacterium]